MFCLWKSDMFLTFGQVFTICSSEKYGNIWLCEGFWIQNDTNGTFRLEKVNYKESEKTEIEGCQLQQGIFVGQSIYHTVPLGVPALLT